MVTESEVSLPLDDPFDWFERWYDLACDQEMKFPNAVTLSTADGDGAPSSRIVLLKEWDRRGFVFYTNYRSRKGRELKENPQAAMTFYWRRLDRQIRIEGECRRVDEATSDAYFKTRPRASQIGAWASNQSSPLASRDALLDAYEDWESEFEGQEVPRPDHWGGYRLSPRRMEFWRAGEARLHDRWEFLRDEDDWTRRRLNP
jgi:pyridoxamine 5'-phosphate oxidase